MAVYFVTTISFKKLFSFIFIIHTIIILRVTFIKVLTIHLSQIHPFHHSLLFPRPHTISLKKKILLSKNLL
jgi:hypothetical protein